MGETFIVNRYTEVKTELETMKHLLYGFFYIPNDTVIFFLFCLLSFYDFVRMVYVIRYEEAFPNILFAKDGEVYDFGGLSCIAIGGAYSIDKFERLEKGWHWFDNEQPSDAIKAFVEDKIAGLGDKVDIVLSHTCPLKYEPREAFSCCIDQRTIDKSTEVWLDMLEDRIEYKRWYCGHYHIDKVFAGMRFMFADIEELRI